MIVEYRFTTFVASHVGYISTIPVKVYGPTGKREANAGRVIFAYCVKETILA
jgi:hypothetical protein